MRSILMAMLLGGCLSMGAYDQDWLQKVDMPLIMLDRFLGLLSLDPLGKDTSDKLYKQLVAFDTFLPFAAIPGFGFAYQDQIGSMQDDIAPLTLTIAAVLNELEGEQINQKISKFLKQANCQADFDQGSLTLLNAFKALASLIKYSSFGNVKALKQQLTDACTKSILTCEQATKSLLDMLGGKRGDDCDLVSNLYEKDLNYNAYRGLKNQYLSSTTYVFTLATLGMSLHAATMAIASDQPSAWVQAQSSFALSQRTALYRIQDFYKTALDETIHNSQSNLVKYIRLYPADFVSTDYDALTVAVQNALQLVAGNKVWFVQVYQAKSQYQVIHTSNCADCFQLYDVNNDYNIFIAGVDTTAEPNQAIQFNNWIAFERSKDYASDLQLFVDDVWSTYCVYGVTAVLNSVKQSLAFPANWPKEGYVFVKDNIKFLVWAIVGNCPGWK